MLLTMSKKTTGDGKSKRPRTTDRHRPRKMVGLPPSLHTRLQELADKNGRPLLWEIRFALEKHAAENGLFATNPPKEIAEYLARLGLRPPSK